jgi:hypothetical protein
MRLIALLVTATMAPAQAMAQQPQPSSPSTTASVQEDALPLNLPVSLDKIREALGQPPAAEPLKGLDERAQFRVEIRERQKMDDLLQSMKFNSGPAVAGGLYAYEQQRQLFPSVDNPLVQPYAAFNQTELLIVSAEALLSQYLVGRAVDGAGALKRAVGEALARQEVQRAIDGYCAAQPSGGAGIQICGGPLRP